MGRGRESISSQSQWSDRNEGFVALIITSVFSGTFLDTLSPTLVLLRIRSSKRLMCSHNRSPQYTWLIKVERNSVKKLGLSEKLESRYGKK